MQGTASDSNFGNPPSATEARIKTLDGLRGLALLCIVSFHAVIICGAHRVDWYPLVRWGPATLDIFFVLSGYLITGILIRARGKPHYFSRFLVRRALRIFPAYYVVLIFVFGLGPLLSAEFAASGTAKDVLWYALYVQNIKTSFEGWPAWPYVAHLWSMAVEEQFYLTWPFVVWLLAPAALARLSCALIVIGIGAKLTVAALGDPGAMAHTSTVTRMGAIAAGSWIACQDPQRVRDWLRLPLLWLGLALGAFIGVHVLRLTPGGGLGYGLATITATLTPGVVILLIHAGRLPHIASEMLTQPLLLWLGRLSYGMYLLHYPVAGIVFEWNADWLNAGLATSPNFTAFVFTLIVFATTTPLAVVMYHLVEAPALALKDRYNPGRRHVAGQQEPTQLKLNPP